MRVYKEYTKIKAIYKANELKHLQETIAHIKEMNAEQLQNTWWIHLTKREATKTLNEQRKIAISKEREKAHKKIEAFNKKCDTINNTPDIDFIKIEVNWSKNRTWGNNPTAEIWTNNGYNKGYASGCGYDKLSSAIATALNKDNGALKLLYNAFEKGLRDKKQENKTPHAILGYGAGYTIPYFEGGVGYTCHQHIFNKLGAKVNIWQDGKMWDFMQIQFSK